MRHDTRFLLAFALLSAFAEARGDDSRREAFAVPGKSAIAIEELLARVPEDQLATMRWFVERMPKRDLETLSTEFLLENHALAHEAWKSAPWGDQVPEAVFRDAILPYASVNEPRDPWRKEFRERFLARVENAKTPGEAATILNNTIWDDLGVKYSTARKRPDQSPKESIESGLASCSGLAIVLVAACRSVGVPARFVGTPLWSDGSGNHSWVEVWTDGGWHFTGAAEPTGDALDQGWFKDRAASATIGDPRTSIYAVTWDDAPLTFPLVWAPKDTSVRAVDVTGRYVDGAPQVPDGFARVRFRVAAADGDRVVRTVRVRDEDGTIVFAGETKDERFDANDHLTAVLEKGRRYRCDLEGAIPITAEFVLDRDELLIDRVIPADGLAADESPRPGAAESAAIGTLVKMLAEGLELAAVAESAIGSVALSRAEAAAAKELLWERFATVDAKRRKAEFDARVVTVGGVTMKYGYRVFGELPENGRSLWISMHGGGNAPPEVNDRQWENQKRLYEPAEGVYVAPRAPTDTWNLWHESHVDSLFQRLIGDLILFEGVNPDRVYLLGYSAGGDGVYQLAPRMADRFAAAAMMAGHPNETRPDGLRNLPFALHMGADDAAFRRNEVAAQWGEALARLAAADPGGYPHQVVIHEGKGHWMDREDRMALPWMAQFTRDPYPEKIVWLQDDVTHPRFYWLAVDEPKAGGRVVVEREDQKIVIREATEVGAIRIRLDDAFVDLDREITVERGGAEIHRGTVPRTIAGIVKTIEERGDPRGIFSAELVIPAPAGK